jgi:hypothetical protein
MTTPSLPIRCRGYNPRTEGFEVTIAPAPLPWRGALIASLLAGLAAFLYLIYGLAG